jgi:hypothetical protein
MADIFSGLTPVPSDYIPNNADKFIVKRLGSSQAQTINFSQLYGNLAKMILGENYYVVSDYGITPQNPDNSPYLQGLINLVALKEENAVIYFPEPSTYIFSGPLRDPSRINSQVIFPSVPITGKQYTITLKGYNPLTFSPSAFSDVPLPSGTVLKSTLAVGSGTMPSFLGGKGPVEGVNGECSYMQPGLENIIITVPSNSQITAVNFDCFTNTLTRGNVVIIAGNSQSILDKPEPTTSTSYGYIQPHNASGVDQRIDGTLSVMGFYNGVRIGENCVADVVGVYACINAIRFSANYGTANIRKLNMGWCKNFLTWDAVSAVHILQMSTERWVAGQGGNPSRWYDFVSDVYDPNNYAAGELLYLTGVAGIGHVPGLFTKIGGINLYVRELGVAPTGGGGGEIDLVNVLDEFTDTDNVSLEAHTLNSGGTWTKIEGDTFTIQGNRLRSYSNGGSATAYTTLTDNADFTLSCVMNMAGSATQNTEIIIRSTDGNNYILCQQANGVIKIYTYIATVYTEIATGTVLHPANTDIPVIVVANGTSIDFTFNGTTISGTTSFNQTATRHGIRLYSPNTSVYTYVDDFECTP